MANDQFDDIGEWASNVAQNYEGELVLSHDEIEQIVDGVVSKMGNLVMDAGEIPTSASFRPRGGFLLPDDLREYLQSGGLLLQTNSGDLAPNSIVWILKRQREGGGTPIYEVYIDDNS